MFHGLLSSDNPDVPSRAAILLSHIHVEEGRCVPRLKAALKHSSPHYQSQVGGLRTVSVYKWEKPHHMHTEVWELRSQQNSFKKPYYGTTR